MALDRERVTMEALALLDDVGLAGLSLRRLADRLGVKAPALYWHFRDKQELLDEMATAMMREMLAEPSAVADVTWQAAMMNLATSLRAALLRYRDGAKVFSGTYVTDDRLLGGMEAPLRVLVDAGFPLRDAVWGYTALYACTIGFVIEEQAVVAPGGEHDPRYDPETRARRIDTGRYPLTAAAGAEAFGSDPDARFRHAIGLIIAGMAQALSTST